MTESHYKLTYYNLRCLGEPIRLIFAYAGVAYEDVRLTPNAENYPKLPEETKNRLPFGKIPVLEFDGKMLSQSSAICKYLAKQYSLVGKDDFEDAQCDEIVGAMQDLLKEYFIASKETDPEKKAILQKEVLEKTFPLYFSKLEKILVANGGKYYVSDALTWVDLYMANFTDIVKDKLPGFLDNYSVIQAASEGVFDLPQIKEWVDKRPLDDPMFAST